MAEEDHLHVHFEERLYDVLERIHSAQLVLIKEIQTMAAQAAADFTALAAQVKKNTDAEDSAVIVINDIAAKLKVALAANDPAAIQALIDQLTAHATPLAAAIVANTSAA